MSELDKIKQLYNVLSDNQKKSPFSNKIEDLEKYTSKMSELTKQKLQGPQEGKYSYFLGNEPSSTSDSYWVHINEKRARTSTLKNFIDGVTELSGNKDNLSNEELAHVQDLTLQMTRLAIQSEHDGETKDLTKMIALGSLETESCFIDGRINLVKGYLTDIVELYAKQGKTPVGHTGNSKRNRKYERINDQTAFSKVEALRDEVLSGAYGGELKNDRTFISMLKDQYLNYGRSSCGYAGMWD